MAVELHFHGPLLSKHVDEGPAEDAPPRETEPSESEGGSGGSAKGVVGVLLALVVLVGIAAAVRKMGKDDEVEVELDE